MILILLLAPLFAGWSDCGEGAPDLGEIDAGGFYPFSMVEIPGGSFFMGCNSVVDSVCEADEHPGRVVYLEPFRIDRYEVSWGAYQMCWEDGACKNPKDLGGGRRILPRAPDHPVSKITQLQALAFCEWLGKTLPTEAQWEKAARGPDGRVYPWGNDWNESLLNWFDEIPPTRHGGRVDGYPSLAPINSFPGGKSPYGVMNMAGNVWEWTLDVYDARFYRNAPGSNPMKSGKGEFITVRGEDGT